MQIHIVVIQNKLKELKDHRHKYLTINKKYKKVIFK
jgi:hypothetical protein